MTHDDPHSKRGGQDLPQDRWPVKLSISLLLMALCSGRIDGQTTQPAEEEITVLPPLENPLKRIGEHQHIINSIVLSPSGKQLFTGSSDNSISRWALADGKQTMQYEGHQGGVASLALSPDGKVLYSGGWDNMVRVWNVDKGEELATLKGHKGTVIALAASANGQYLVSAGDGVRIWDARKRELMHELREHEKTVWSLAISPDSTLLLSGSGDETVRLTELATGKTVRVFTGLHQRVRAVTFSPDGKWIAAAAVGGNVVRMWDSASGEEIARFEGNKTGVMSLCFSPNGKRLVVGGGRLNDQGEWDIHNTDGGIWVWDPETTAIVQRFQGHTGYTNGLIFTPDGNTLISSGWDNQAKVWRVK